MKILFFIITLIASLQASSKIDIFNLTYTGKTKQCAVEKNSKIIPAFDKKFKKMKKPRNGYDCYMIQKETYKSCKITDKKGITALIFAYGVYANTNLITAFKSNAKVVDASVQVQCSKTLDLK